MSFSSSSTCRPRRPPPPSLLSRPAAGFRRPRPIRPRRGLPAVAALIFLLGAATPLFPQIAICNPSIPSEERIVYTETFDGAKGTTTETLHLVTEGAKSWYEVLQSSPKVDSLFRLDAGTLFPFYTETSTHEGHAEVRKSMQVVEIKGPFKADELPVSDPNALGLELRGFPWGSRDSARLVFIGQNGVQNLSFSLAVEGKEALELGGRVYECWKVQLGLDGFVGAFIPKTYFWFLAEAPHYLVKFEGLSGAPGSPKRTLVLRSYESDAPR